MSNQYCPLRKTDILLILNICYDCLRKRVYAIRVRYISITSVFIYLFLQSCDNLYYILKHFVDIYKFFIHVLSIKVKSILQARVTKTRQLVVRKNVNSLIFCGQTGQKQSSRGVLKNRCYENMQQIYRGHSCRSVISIKLLCNFIEITFWGSNCPWGNYPGGNCPRARIKTLKKRCSENMQQIYRGHPCRSVILVKLLRNFIEITLRHGCFL